MDNIISNEALERLDNRAERVRQLMTSSTQAQITQLWKQLDFSLIYHDCALEGQVVSSDELNAAFNERTVTDASSLQLYNALRSQRRAVDLVREMAAQEQLVFSIDLFKQFHHLYVPSASNPEKIKHGHYRKEIPLHRSYFHEISEPARISGNMRQLIAWLNDPEEALALHPLKWVAKFHYRFMRIFPFAETSGKIARATMNMVLIRTGYLPAIIHATERQRYYECIRQPLPELTRLLAESANSSLDAAEKFLRRRAKAS